MPTPELSSLAFFAGVPGPGLQDLQAASRELRCPRGHVIFRQGDESTHTFLLLEGSVRLSATNPDGVEVVLDHLSAGDCFGIVGVVGPLPRQSTAVVTSRARLLQMPTRALHAVMQARPELFSHVLRQLVQRLAQADQEKVVLASQRVYGRLALKLLTLSRSVGEARRLPAHLSHRELAALIGSTRATVTRAFQELRRQGIVEEDADGVIIRREDSLRELVDWSEGSASEGSVVP